MEKTALIDRQQPPALNGNTDTNLPPGTGMEKCALEKHAVLAPVAFCAPRSLAANAICPRGKCAVPRPYLRLARALALLMALLLFVLPALAEPLPFTAPPPFEMWPARTPEGFLQADDFSPVKEYVFADDALGRWIYLSRDLQISIERRSGRYEKRDVVWYMADIRFTDGQAFRAFSADPARPSRAQDRPENIANNNRVVYAQNGDLFSARVYNKERVGLIIRDGKVLYENTYTHPVAKIPPLDELALFPDGKMEMRTPGEYSAQDYLFAGALDVMAFGPILFRDRVKDDRLEKSFTHREPRSAIGIIAPKHFLGIMVEGRNKRSAGAPLRFVADRLLEAGCYEAFTLDGGQTAAMLFMGKNVTSPGIYSGYQKARKQQDILGIGRWE